MTISILCGGSGTRLFPLSRELMPKQFAPILPSQGTKPHTTTTNMPTSPSQTTSLFQETLLRNAFLIEKHQAKFQIITNEHHYFLASDEAQKCGITLDEFILESVGKNTAPALTFAAMRVLEALELNEVDNDLVLALPSDHLIKKHTAYQEVIAQAIDFAQKGFLVTFGITPDSPHTGYGYIKAKDNLVEKFIEKPSLKDAQEYLKDGGYLWNSGMFCFRAEVFLKELKTHASEVYEPCKLLFEASKLKRQSVKIGESLAHCLRLDAALSQKLPDISIDYALMEKSQKVACVAGDLGWNDVGSFESLSLEYPKDENLNTSKGAFVGKNCKNNFIISDKLVAGIGLEDLMIIEQSDCLLVAKRGHSQQVKDIVSQLKITHPEITKVHNTAHRPWGSYTILLESHNYKIKQIVVKPKARLSLQKHHHRNEHWIVVSGSAIVQIGEETSFLKANESTYIPMGKVHRLENPGILPLVLIEVQMGEYLGEDDIVRLSDDYAREG